jgi:alkylated DNA repair dioxygenase AlkB
MSFNVGYIEDYITPEEEAYLIHEIDARPWSNVLKRRVQHYGYEYNYKSRNLVVAESIPRWPIVERIEREFFRPEQVIINEYLPGQGISKHIDADKFGEPIISLSLGSPCVMTFRQGDVSQDVLLKPRSLLIMSGESRWKWTHEIPPRKKDKVNGTVVKRERRISLTFRRLNV